MTDRQTEWAGPQGWGGERGVGGRVRERGGAAARLPRLPTPTPAGPLPHVSRALFGRVGWQRLGGRRRAVGSRAVTNLVLIIHKCCIVDGLGQISTRNRHCLIQLGNALRLSKIRAGRKDPDGSCRPVGRAAARRSPRAMVAARAPRAAGTSQKAGVLFSRRCALAPWASESRLGGRS